MSSIARPRRTEFDAIAERVTRRRVATAAATILFVVLIISFRPFRPAGPAETGGDIVNQLGFGSLGAASLFMLASFVDRRVLAALLSPWWLILLGFFMLSVLNAEDPSAAFRTAMFTLIGILTVCAILTLPRDADAFSTVLAVGGGVIVGLCYVGLVIFPNEAIHGGGGFEPQHAGFWRGAFSHKNIAGPVMACLCFAGLYLWRRGWKAVGAVLFVAALFFMSNTGSKTTAGLVPLSIILVAGPALFGLRAAVPWIFAAAIGGAAVATVGIVLSDTLWGWAQSVAPGLDYTGRTALWEFLLEMIALKPWTGYGYESFWGTLFIFTMDQPFDRDWDIRGIVHGHNGYLDIAVLMGVPALCAAIVAFLVVPLIDFAKVRRLRENVLMADLFMMMLFFTALNALLESFFFRRADPVWLFFVMAAFGLRLIARFPVKSTPAG